MSNSPAERNQNYFILIELRSMYIKLCNFSVNILSDELPHIVGLIKLNKSVWKRNDTNPISLQENLINFAVIRFRVD